MIESCLTNWKQLPFFLFYWQVENATGHHVATNLDNKIKWCYSVDYLFIFLGYSLIYFLTMISWSSKQYHNNALYAGQRRNYLCTFGRTLIWLADMSLLYACVRMVLDSQGPIIKFMSMSLKQKQTPQNYFSSGQMYVLSILIIYPQLKGVLNIPILSISLFECRPAWLHLQTMGHPHQWRETNPSTTQQKLLHTWLATQTLSPHRFYHHPGLILHRSILSQVYSSNRTIVCIVTTQVYFIKKRYEGQNNKYCTPHLPQRTIFHTGLYFKTFDSM